MARNAQEEEAEFVRAVEHAARNKQQMHVENTGGQITAGKDRQGTGVREPNGAMAAAGQKM